MTSKQDITLDILYTNKLKYFQNNDKIIILIFITSIMNKHVVMQQPVLLKQIQSQV